MSPAAFEDLVLDVLDAMGYGDEGEAGRENYTVKRLDTDYFGEDA